MTAYIVCIHFFNLFRWSFGVLLMEIITLGELFEFLLMCLHLSSFIPPSIHSPSSTSTTSFNDCLSSFSTCGCMPSGFLWSKPNHHSLTLCISLGIHCAAINNYVAQNLLICIYFPIINRMQQVLEFTMYFIMKQLHYYPCTTIPILLSHTGQTPYPGKTVDEVIECLRSKKTMTKPQSCPTKV